MLDGVAHLLRRLLLDEVTLLTPLGGTVQDDQIGFQPPDKDWRAKVTTGGKLRALDVYLVDLREHLEYRGDEPAPYPGGSRPRPPAWLDCHYLITAWSPAISSAGGRLDEHAMLYQVVAALLARPVLRAAEVFRGKPFPAGYPAAMRDAELPTAVVPGDGFPKLAEFWGAMGGGELWRPVVYLVVTVPVGVPALPAGPPVVTRLLALNQPRDVADARADIAIGGRVLAPAGPGGTAVTVPGAWVGLETATGVALRSARTDADGRFRFDGLTTDRYRLRCRALGRAEPVPRDVDVPSPTGDYDLTLA